MMRKKLRLLLAAIFVASIGRAGTNEVAGAAHVLKSPDPAAIAMMQEAERLIAAYHQGQPRSTNVLRVVYFVPKDGEPFTNYEERLDRVMNDVNAFYRDGLRRFGIESDGLPLERKDGRLVLHVVHGRLPADKYSYKSGDDTEKEIHRALKGEFDTDREHVLVFYALCTKAADGHYTFNAPYYGGGSQSAGLCHAADCELLDPLLLTATNRSTSIVFSEHYYPSADTTLAKFNTMYLGGTAHELGHALGLPHDNGGEAEQLYGISLMGVGNLTYREELWGGGPPTYLSQASVLLLASHPLVTGSDRGRWDDPKGAIKSLKFEATNSTLTIQGRVTGAIPPYAVIAYLWPVSKQVDDHIARTFSCVVKDGAFNLALDGFHPGGWRDFHLAIAHVHVNGGGDGKDHRLRYDDTLEPDATAMKSSWLVDGKRVPLAAGSDVAALKADWIVDHAEAAVMHSQPDARKIVEDSLAAAPTPEAARKLRALHAVLDPPEPFDLAAVPGDSACLSDAVWTDAKVGWGKVARNHYWFDGQITNGVFLVLGGQVFDKGLYAHASSRYVFPLGGKWKTFTATIGLRDGANVVGSAVFTVRGDGRELFRSRILRVNEREDVTVDISQVKELELLTEGGEGHNHSSWAIWAEPVVRR